MLTCNVHDGLKNTYIPTQTYTKTPPPPPRGYRDNIRVRDIFHSPPPPQITFMSTLPDHANVAKIDQIDQWPIYIDYI